MSKADENPFAAVPKKPGRGRPKAEPEAETPLPIPPAPEDDSETYLLGQPATSFKAHEKQYITEQQKQYLKILKKSPGAKVYVQEIILTAVEMERHDASVATQRRTWGSKKLSEEETQWLLRMDKVRSGLLARHTAALEAIGYLPKDSALRDSTSEETLSSVHIRYIKEIEARKASGQGIGRPTAEALDLARSVGLNPEKYQSAALPDSVRDDAIKDHQDGKVDEDDSDV